jgi:hypothetical protein
MENSGLNYYEQDLLLRLVAMGAAPPVELDSMNQEKLEDIVVKLPSIHVYQFEGNDRDGQFRDTVCCDLSAKGLRQQVFNELKHYDIKDDFESRAGLEYSPEAWMVYLRKDFSSVDANEVCDVFARWGISLEPEQVAKGFSADFAENLEFNSNVLKKQQIDLLSRLSAAGFIEPVDLENISLRDADQIIKGLPSLTEATLIFNDDGEYIRQKFINVDEFYIKDVYMGVADEYNSSLQQENALNDNFEEEFSVDERLSTTGYEKTRKVIGAGTSTLDKQVRQFFDENPNLEDKLIHKTIGTVGGMAWLDYFKQDVRHACPGDTGKEFVPLKRAFKNWDLETSKVKPQLAFRDDGEANFRDGQLSFYRKLIQKVFHAGIVQPMPLEDWHNLNTDIATEFVRKIPLLPGQETPGEWMAIFRHNFPSATELNELKNQFETAGIIYDEDRVKSSFKQSPQTPKQQKGDRKMSELTVDDYKKMMGRLGNKGMPRLEKDEWKNITLEEARNKVRMYDDAPSDKQIAVIADMISENRLDGGKIDLGAISKMEATVIIDNAPKLEIPKEPPANPITEETKKELLRFVKQEKIPYIPQARLSVMSEEEGRMKIDNVRARTPATEKQIELIKSEIEAGNITGKDLAQFINSKTIGKKEIDGLNMLQAGKILESRPATDAQKEQLNKLFGEKRLEPFDMKGLTSGGASKILDKAFNTERDPKGPATENQKNALKELSANREIPEIKPAELEKMTFAQAAERLEAAPATRAQKRIISQFVSEEKLDYVPTDAFANLTRGEASHLVQIGKGEIPRDQQPDFSKREYPASNSQMKALEELREKGKIQEIPQNITSKQADAMIKDASNSDPIGTNQIRILENKIAQGFLPAMNDEEKKNLNRGGFLELMEKAQENEKSRPQEQKPPAADKAKGKSKEPTMSR